MASSATEVRRQRGSASVETAVVLALFLIPLLLGLTDVARLLFTRIALQEAAQQGAVYYAFEETVTTAEVVSKTIASIDSPVIQPSEVTTTCVNEARTTTNGAVVTVNVSQDVDLVFPFLGGPVTVARVATAERFYPCP